MLNKRAPRDEHDMQNSESTDRRQGRGGNRKDSRTSDLSDNKQENGRSNGNGRRNGSNLRKRDGMDSRANRKRSESSNSSRDSDDKKRSSKNNKKDKSGRFDSSESERSVSRDNSDNESVSNDRNKKRFSPERRNDSFNKRQKTDNNSEFEVYVGYLSYDAREDDIKKHFGSCGQITQIKILTRDDGKSKGKGFIKFADEKAMKNALRLNGTDMMGRKIVVEVPANASKNNNSGNGNQESSSVIVRNLPFNLDEEEFGNLFEDCGSITKFRIIKKETGESKGFGFVDFESTADARKALSKNGMEIKGRNITVDFSVPKDNRNSGFNRGFRGGDRRDDRGFRGGDRRDDRRRGYGNDRPNRGYRRND